MNHRLKQLAEAVFFYYTDFIHTFIKTQSEKCVII